MRAFDDATATRPGTAPGRFEAELDARWSVGGKPNGGYLLALLARAAATTVADAGVVHPDVLTASASYLRPPEPGPAAVTVEVLRTGRAASQVRATLAQAGRQCVDATLTLGTLDRSGTPRWTEEGSSVATVDLPAIDECVRLPAVDHRGTPVPLLELTDVRLDPAVLGFATGRPAGAGKLRGWIRFADGGPPDLAGLIYMLDALPPATLELGSSGWVPTLQLTVYLRAHAAPGPLAVRQRARLVDGGTVDEVCDIWDAGGRLVAQGFQLALVRFPDDPPQAGGPPDGGADGR